MILGGFSVLSVSRPLEALEIRQTLLYSIIETHIGFSLIPKQMNLTDLQWLFYTFTHLPCRLCILSS